MSKSDEFYTFDETLRELKIFEDDLKKMVSEGELRAFKDEDKMKFRKGDIEAVKAHITDPTVLLEPDEAETPASPTAETFIEDTSKVHTADIASDTDIIEDVQASDIGSDTDIIEDVSNIQTTDIGTDTSLQIPDLMEETKGTAPADVIEETVADLKAIEEVSAEETIIEKGAAITEPAPEEEPTPDQTVIEKPKPRHRKKISRFAAPAAEQEAVYSESFAGPMPAPKFKTPIIFVAVLGALLLCLIFIGSFIGDSLRISSDRGKYPVGITRDLGQKILDILGVHDVKLDKFKNADKLDTSKKEE